MAEQYGCAQCGSELLVTRTKIDSPSDPTDVPHEIVVFNCPTCKNEFSARSPYHPKKGRK